MLPELVQRLGWCPLGIVQASLGRVLGVVLLRQTCLRLVEAWVPKTTVLRGLLYLCLAEATLLTLSLETIEVARWNRCS
jgi:hypothetical protein